MNLQWWGVDMDEELLEEGWESCCSDGSCDICYGEKMEDYYD